MGKAMQRRNMKNTGMVNRDQLKAKANAGPSPGDYPQDRAIKKLPLPTYLLPKKEK